MPSKPDIGYVPSKRYNVTPKEIYDAAYKAPAIALQSRNVARANRLRDKVPDHMPAGTVNTTEKQLKNNKLGIIEYAKGPMDRWAKVEDLFIKALPGVARNETNKNSCGRT